MSALFPNEVPNVANDTYMVFRGCKKGKNSPPGDYPVTREQIAEWQRKYPDVDVKRELHYMLEWWDTEPARHKTIKGMPRFFRNWLGKNQRREDRRKRAWDRGARRSIPAGNESLDRLHRQLEFYTRQRNEPMIRNVQRQIQEMKNRES